MPESHKCEVNLLAQQELIHPEGNGTRGQNIPVSRRTSHTHLCLAFATDPQTPSATVTNLIPGDVFIGFGRIIKSEMSGQAKTAVAEVGSTVILDEPGCPLWFLG